MRHDITTDAISMPTVVNREQRPEHARQIAVEIWVIFSAIVATVIGLIAVFLFVRLNQGRGVEWALLITLVTFLIVFVTLFIKKGLPFTESLLGRDINGDGVIGAPVQQRTEEITTRSIWEEPDHTAIIEFEGVAPEDLRYIADKFLNGETGTRSFPGREKKMATVRDTLIRRQFAAWKDPMNHQAGFLLNVAGTRYLKSLLQND
jgi:hypothetical protein